MNEYYQRGSTFWRVNGKYVIRVVNHGSSSEIKAGINEFIMPSMFDDDVKLISKKEFEDEFICALSVLRSGPFSDLSGNIII